MRIASTIRTMTLNIARGIFTLTEFDVMTAAVVGKLDGLPRHRSVYCERQGACTWLITPRRCADIDYGRLISYRRPPLRAIQVGRADAIVFIECHGGFPKRARINLEGKWVGSLFPHIIHLRPHWNNGAAAHVEGHCFERRIRANHLA